MGILDQAHDGQIHLVVEQALLHGEAVEHVQRQFDVGILAVKRAERRRDDVDARGGAGRDLDGAAPAAAQLFHDQTRLFQQAKDALAVAEQLAPRLRQMQGATDLLEERQADALLQRFDLQRDARLAEIEHGGGARVAALLSHGLEDVQLMEVDVHVIYPKFHLWIA